MVMVDVAEQYRVDLAEPRVVRTTDRESGVIQDPRAIGVLEDQGAVDSAKLAIVTAEGGDLYDPRSGGMCLHFRATDCQHRHCQTHNQFLHGCLPHSSLIDASAPILAATLRRTQSAFAPEARTISPYFVISALTNAANASGVFGIGSAPSTARRS